MEEWHTVKGTKEKLLELIHEPNKVSRFLFSNKKLEIEFKAKKMAQLLKMLATKSNDLSFTSWWKNKAL